MITVVSIVFVQKDGSRTKVSAKIGATLLEVAQENQIDLIGACNGACACGTCHVYIDDETLSRIGPSSTNEENVLDIVFGVTSNSRLACQIIITKDMDGMIVTIP